MRCISGIKTPKEFGNNVILAHTNSRRMDTQKEEPIRHFTHSRSSSARSEVFGLLPLATLLGDQAKRPHNPFRDASALPIIALKHLRPYSLVH